MLTLRESLPFSCAPFVRLGPPRTWKGPKKRRFYGWAHRDSNPEPRDYESLALTVELWARAYV